MSDKGRERLTPRDAQEVVELPSLTARGPGLLRRGRALAQLRALLEGDPRFMGAVLGAGGLALVSETEEGRLIVGASSPPRKG